MDEVSSGVYIAHIINDILNSIEQSLKQTSKASIGQTFVLGVVFANKTDSVNTK